MRTQLPTTTFLHNSYRTVNDLYTYINEVLHDSRGSSCTQPQGFSPADTDSPAYHRLLYETYVATNQKPTTRLEYEESHVGMDEAIKRAQSLLFRSQHIKHNILKAGYRMAGGSTIVNMNVNTVLTALLSQQWETLLRRVGIAMMLHLLMETSIFVSLPNGCLCQMTGEPFIVPPGDLQSAIAENTKKFLKRTASSESHEEPPSKRRKLETRKFQRSRQDACKIKTPSLISIIRARMLYARPNYVPKSNKIVIGLPLRHAFNIGNRDGSMYHCPLGKPLVWDGKDQALKARHMMRYIFPRQHGLGNPFQLHHSGEVYEYRDYTDREDEIKRALKLTQNMSTPKRLKDIVPLADKMLWKHLKCPYKLLLNKLCPSKIGNDLNPNIDEDTILEWMSERSIQIQTQGPLDANMSTLSTGNISISASVGDPAPKPRFAEFTCSYVEVFRYVVVIVKAVIPKSFWGSKKNFKVIMNHLKSFITGRRFETLSLHDVLQGFSTSDCDWLIPPGSGARQQHRVSVSDALKRRELLDEFLFWFFDSFVLPLIKTCFYVTESSAFRNQLLYFRQDDWVTLCAPLIGRLKAATFEKLSETDAAEILRQRELGFSFVRLLPKETGVRPIVNLRRKPNGSGRSINQVLQAAFDLLTYEKKTRPHLTGASVWGSDEIYARLIDFKTKVKPNKRGRLPKFYFVKVDVQACFDTIDQGKLLGIIKELISENRYTIRKYAQIRLCRNHEDPNFLDMAMELASALRNMVFLDQPEALTVTKSSVLQLLNSHIMDNIVKIGSNYYRQVVGIPQGSVLSSLLCSFFYGDLEHKFGSYTDSPDSTLFRVIDDYLLVTTNLAKARSFLKMMNEGHPEYGCFISKEKTMSNFDYDHQIMNVVDQRARHFHWCGYAIDMKDLSISVDYTRYHGINLSSTLTVTRGRKPGASFAQKMVQLAKIRSHVIYTDPVLNRKPVIYLNIYQNLLLAAMKMHCYLREWDTGWHKHTGFIRGTVQKMIDASFASMRSQAKRRQLTSSGTKFLKKEAVTW
ncbi:hypothetical protein D9756_003256 [Leucocoprinus leucothites]|uniref:Telomerase reverse transcriptase n=1 Tax=Leucocoprinus leucothites TaxID=201217 RepID=A0A8H5LJ84_9AGAR|nr:hypothetical protein D9756_003256 [Leucoagaricus leucothites]